jgi:hypothetical protein
MILDRLRRKKKPTGPSLSRSEFLSIRPVRNPVVEWEKNEKGEIKVIIPIKKIKEEAEKRRKKRPRGPAFLSRMFPEPKEKRIQLDVVGSAVWELCDGKRTTKEIVDFLCQNYKLLPREAEISLSTYLNSLVKRGLIAFILPDELRERLAKREAVEKQEK